MKKTKFTIIVLNGTETKYHTLICSGMRANTAYYFFYNDTDDGCQSVSYYPIQCTIITKIEEVFEEKQYQS